MSTVDYLIKAINELLETTKDEELLDLIHKLLLAGR